MDGTSTVRQTDDQEVKMSENTIHVTRSIHAPPAEVCRGFTHATLLRDWLSNASSIEAYKGGHLFLRWRDGRTVTGTYEQIDPPQGMRFTWLDTELQAPSVIQVTCSPEGEGTLLTLEQTGQIEPSGAGCNGSFLEAIA
jgi:uncharacterized protein YndB with AHSA1/START domain